MNAASGLEASAWWAHVAAFFGLGNVCLVLRVWVLALENLPEDMAVHAQKF